MSSTVLEPGVIKSDSKTTLTSPKESSMSPDPISLMIKESPTQSTDSLFQVKTEELPLLSPGSEESLPEPLKKPSRNLKSTPNAALRKECSWMKQWLKWWINWNLKNYWNSRKRDGVDWDLWYWAKISKAPKIFPGHMSYKSLILVFTRWLEESGQFSGKWEKM